MSSSNLDWGDLQQEAEKLGGLDREEDSTLGRREDESKFASHEGEGKDAAADDEEDAPQLPPKPRKSAGWGEVSADNESKSPSEEKSDGGKKSKRVSAARSAMSPKTPEENSETSKPKGNRHFQSTNDDDNIMIIPDLDEDKEEDLQLQVAEAPQNFRVVQSMRELDSQISGLHLPKGNSEESSRLDLSILTSVLIPRDKLEEPDEAWEFGQLLEQVSQEMTKQKETNEEFEKTKASGTQAKMPTPSSPAAAISVS